MQNSTAKETLADNIDPAIADEILSWRSYLQSDKGKEDLASLGKTEYLLLCTFQQTKKEPPESSVGEVTDVIYNSCRLTREDIVLRKVSRSEPEKEVLKKISAEQFVKAYQITQKELPTTLRERIENILPLRTKSSTE